VIQGHGRWVLGPMRLWDLQAPSSQDWKTRGAKTCKGATLKWSLLPLPRKLLCIGCLK
jgi:hypothetical protein